MLSNLLITSTTQNNSSDAEHDFPDSFETDYESLAYTSGGSAFSLALAQIWVCYLTFLDLNESIRKSECEVASSGKWAAGNLLHFP